MDVGLGPHWTVSGWEIGGGQESPRDPGIKEV